MRFLLCYNCTTLKKRGLIMIFNTHAHYDDEQFDEDRDELLMSMQDGGVGTIVDVSASYESCKRVTELAEKYPFMYAAVGVHPDNVGSLNEETFAEMKQLFENPNTKETPDSTLY